MKTKQALQLKKTHKMIFMKPGKSIIVLILFFLSGFLTCAQTYHLFVIPGKHWNVVHTNTEGGNPNSARTFKYWTTLQDTIVNDTVYKIVFSEGDWWAENGIIGFLREDTNEQKVYFRSTGVLSPSNQDQLLYDFSVEPGDTVNVYGYLSCNWQGFNSPYIVKSIGDTTLLNGEVKKTWYLQSVENSNAEEDIWIEDIGSLNGFLYPCCYMYATISFKHELLCYGINQQELYVSELDTCYVDWTTGTDIELMGQLNIYPNPVTGGIIQIETPKGFDRIKKIEVVDVFGKPMIITDGKERVLNVQMLCKGLYFIRIYTEGRLIIFKFLNF